jgi:nicotinamidase-related amidase
VPSINATPFAYNFDTDHIALICIDMQRDFCLPGGFGEVLGNDVSLIAPCIPVIARLQAAFRKARLPVIHTKECHKPDLSDLPTAKQNRGNPKLKIGDKGPMGRILIDGEEGSDFVPDLRPLPGELVIAKPGKDAFYRTDLREYLVTRGITNLVVTGCTTEVCVQSSMRAAYDRGYDCILVEDGTESYFPEFKSGTIKAMTAQGGIIGWSCPSAAILAVVEALGHGAAAAPASNGHKVAAH